MSPTAATPWLDDAEQQAWRSYLRGAHALEVRLDAELQEVGLSLAEYELMSMLSEADGRAMRMSALADLVIQSRSRVTHTANRLERRGWVTRRAAAGDGRGVELVLTEGGCAAVTAASDTHVRGVRTHFVDRLDREQFLAVGAAMGRVREHLT